MALAQDTPILLLDEPTTYLDLAHQLEVLDLLADLNAQGRTIGIVLHDLNHACRYAHHLVALRDGRVHAAGRARGDRRRGAGAGRLRPARARAPRPRHRHADVRAARACERHGELTASIRGCRPRPTCSRCARRSRSRAAPPTRRPSWWRRSSTTGSSPTARARRSTTGARRPRASWPRSRPTASAARRRSVRRRGDRSRGSRHGTARRAPRWRSTASSTTGSGAASGSRVWRLLGTERVTPPTSYTIGIDTVEGTADRDAPRAGLRGAQDQGRRAGRPRAAARRARRDLGAAADRRQRGLGPRDGARAHCPS